MIGLFVAVLLLIFSGALFVGRWIVHEPTTNASETITYNQFVFTKQQDIWATQWQHNGKLYELNLRFNPVEVENVPVIGALNTSLFNQREVFITFDPNILSNYKYVALAGGELGLSLKRALGREPIFACTTNETTAEACLNSPPVTCDDADKGVILIQPANTTEIHLSANCIVLQGQDLELVRAADKLLYLWYGIMKRA